MMMRVRTPCSVLRTMGGAWRHMDFSPFTINVPGPPTSFSLSKARPAYLHQAYHLAMSLKHSVLNPCSNSKRIAQIWAAPVTGLITSLPSHLTL